MAASRVGIWRRLRLISPGVGTAMPLAMASSTLRTMSFTPSCCARWSPNSFSSGK